MIRVSEVTRRNLFDSLRLGNFHWSGRLDEPSFLQRVFDLEAMRSLDHRFANAHDDIFQHRVRNWDWEPDWVFDDPRFNLLRCDDDTLFRFLCEMLHPVVRNESDDVGAWRDNINQHLNVDGFELYQESSVSGSPVFSVRATTPGDPLSGVAVAKLSDIAEAFNAHVLHRQIERIVRNVDADPDFAIGTSKELLETTCKTILNERGVSVEKSWDFPKLVSVTRKELKLLPDNIPNSSRGARSVKGVLAALGTVSQGIAEVRNLYGTGHGRDGTSRGLPSRHARLMAGCATTLASFLFETHQERENATG